jgi:hypothetical protein
LDNISTPQTLNIQGYIKNKKVTILIDYGSTHNFINYKLAKDLNCFVYHAPEFQVMIADGGTINCSGKCHSIKLNIGIEIRGIKGKPSKVISSNSMTKLLKKGHQGVVAQLCSLDVQTSIAFAPSDLQIVINNHSKVFGEMPKGLPPA